MELDDSPPHRDSGGAVGLITARGGSKGIPRKNLAPLAGKPLIDWTIDAARRCGELDAVYLSTEDREIAERRKGSEVLLIERPPVLAQDDSTHDEVVAHALDAIRDDRGEDPSCVVLLQPTSPLRVSEDITACITLLRRKDADAVMAVSEVRTHPFLMYQMMKNGTLIPFLETDKHYERRQQLPDLVAPNGAVYAIRTNRFRESGTIKMERTFGYLMPSERSIDIDTELDLRFAEFLLSHD